MPHSYKKTIHSFLLLIFLIIAPASNANVHLEPYAGIGAAYSSSNNSPPVSLIYNLGARAGYKIFNVTTGLDIFFNFYNSASSSSFPVVRKPQTTTGFKQAGESLSIFYSETDEHILPFFIGAFGIFEVPLLFDVYGTAFYSFADSKYHGPGLKAGITYISSFFFNLNLELQWTHYFCKEASCKTSRINTLALILSLSAPFSLNLFNSSESQNQQYQDQPYQDQQYQNQQYQDQQDDIQSLSTE